MIEISLSNIKKSYGFKNILDNLNIEIKNGDKVSLIGENGCGKSTILKIISKLESVDSGTVAIRSGTTIGYLSQQPENIYKNKIVKNILYDSLVEILELEKKLKRLLLKNIRTNTLDLEISKRLKV